MNKLTTDEHKILVDAIHDSATIIHKGQMMNERIKLLAEQAGIYKLDLSDETEYWIIEKFAELIVRECMQVASPNYMSTPEDSVYYVEQAINRIAEHFGVEE